MIENIVNQIVSSTGTGDLALGAAVNSFTSFGSVFSDGDQVFYSVIDGDNRETGLATYNQGANSLSRTVIFENLVSGVYDANPLAAINVTAGATVSCSPSVQALTTLSPSWKRAHANIIATPGMYTPDDPTFATVAGNVKIPVFAEGGAIIQTNFNIAVPHDIGPDTQAFLCVHWCPMDGTTGNVYWGAEFANAKEGNNLSSTGTFFITSAAAGNKGNVTIAEFANPLTLAEPSSIIAGRLLRDSGNGNDTYAGDAGLLGVSLIYQAKYHGTPSKTPDYYSWS